MTKHFGISVAFLDKVRGGRWGCGGGGVMAKVEKESGKRNSDISL